tara:strand:+ start:1409 stop:2053 length:645 start_codon:yes stop_codon:yes gene_type:complete
MKNKKTLILGSITLVLAIFLAASLWYKNQEAESFTKEVSKKQSMLERDHSPTLGPDDAKVTLVEFLDPECESCRAFYPFVKELMAKHPNDIRLVVRYAPFHGNSKFAIKILEAARKQNKYWEALGVLFYFQPQWGDHHNPQPELIWSYLPQAGIDVEQVKKDLDDPKVVKLIEIDSQDVKDLGVRATPSFFVNGKPLTEFGFNQLESLIESELK